MEGQEGGPEERKQGVGYSPGQEGSEGTGWPPSCFRFLWDLHLSGIFPPLPSPPHSSCGDSCPSVGLGQACLGPTCTRGSCPHAQPAACPSTQAASSLEGTRGGFEIWGHSGVGAANRDPHASKVSSDYCLPRLGVGGQQTFIEHLLCAGNRAGDPAVGKMDSALLQAQRPLREGDGSQGNTFPDPREFHVAERQETRGSSTRRWPVGVGCVWSLGDLGRQPPRDTF